MSFVWDKMPEPSFYGSISFHGEALLCLSEKGYTLGEIQDQFTDSLKI